jgi:hypothetical protein
MADWLPGWPRHLFNLRGKPYQFTHNPKGCLHTTEGSSIAGALGAYAPYPPHGIYDWRNREKLQHIPLSLASYSAMDGNDDDYMVQIELVGFAAESRFWPDQAWRNIAEDVIKPLEDHFGIPRRIIWHGFKDARDGIYPYLSSTASPIRLNATQLRDFAGWLGHQHLPAPDEHWDPGALQLQKAFAYLEEDMATGADVWNEPIESRNFAQDGYKPQARAWLLGADYNAGMAWETARRIEAKLDALTDKLSDDEASIIAAVRAISSSVDMTDEQMAALLGGISAQTKEALKAALREGTDA